MPKKPLEPCGIGGKPPFSDGESGSQGARFLFVCFVPLLPFLLLLLEWEFPFVCFLLVFCFWMFLWLLFSVFFGVL